MRYDLHTVTCLYIFLICVLAQFVIALVSQPLYGAALWNLDQAALYRAMSGQGSCSTCCGLYSLFKEVWLYMINVSYSEH